MTQNNLNIWPCPERPEELLGQPIGMYHCPYCGEMQVGGVTHLEPQELDYWDISEEYKKQLRERYLVAENRRLHDSIPDSSVEGEDAK